MIYVNSTTMVDHVGTLFLPGDTIHNLNKSEKTGKLIIGPGLRQESETIIVSKPGLLRHKEPNMYWIDSHQKRVSNSIWTEHEHTYIHT